MKLITFFGFALLPFVLPVSGCGVKADPTPYVSIVPSPVPSPEEAPAPDHQPEATKKAP